MKNSVVFLLLLTVFIASCADNKSIKKSVDINCTTLNACLNEIKNVEYEKYGISKEASSLAEKFPDYGEQALIELIELLKSNDPTTLKVTGYAIAEFNSIDQKYFPQIKTGIEKDVPWLARALGAIRSDEAAKYALEIYLTASSSPHNQEAVAVKSQGDRVLPFILEQAKCGERCDMTKLGLLTHIIGEMDEAVKQLAAERIIEELNVSTISKQNKRNLIGLFYKMGDSGKLVEDQLYDIRQKSPDLGRAIDPAFIGIKSKYSGHIFASHLKSSPDIFALRDVAEIGPAAKDAGPVLIELLSHPDRDIRLGAVRALGYLQYADAVPLLLPLMTEKTDVRVNWAATVSLGMIAQPGSIEALESVGGSHWYPTVRDAAKQAAQMIKNKKEYDSKNHPNNFAFDFFSYEHFDVESCEDVTLKYVPEDPSRKLNSKSKMDDLKKLTYDSYILSYGAEDEEEQREKDPDAIIEVNRYNMVEHREDIKQIPDVALKIEDGWLAGSSRGEWGGELVFIPGEGKAIKLLDANVEDVYKFGEKYIVVSGLSHMGLNNGQVFQLYRKDNEWSVESWINLPAAPRTSWFVETGELLINTYSGGSVLLSQSGDLRMAPCKKNKPKLH